MAKRTVSRRYRVRVITRDDPEAYTGDKLPRKSTAVALMYHIVGLAGPAPTGFVSIGDNTCVRASEIVGVWVETLEKTGKVGY